MTKRLQVLLDDDELDDIRTIARRRRQTTAAFVRDALRAAREAATYPSLEMKLRAVREAVVNDYPTGDIEQLLAEIERGAIEATDA